MYVVEVENTIDSVILYFNDALIVKHHQAKLNNFIGSPTPEQ